MTDDLFHLLAAVPPKADRAIVIYPVEGGQWACQWIGLSAQQAASVLSQMADGVVDQRLALRPAE